MATPTPPPVMPMSDPEERIYRSDDFRVSDPDAVRPTPMYCGDKLSAVTFTMLPGQIHEAHMHTDMTQAWIILEGTGEAILGNGRPRRRRPRHDDRPSSDADARHREHR